MKSTDLLYFKGKIKRKSFDLKLKEKEILYIYTSDKKVYRG